MKKTSRELLFILTCATVIAGPFLTGRAQAQPSWAMQSSGGPSPRSGHWMVYDSCRGVSVLYGGANHSDTPPTLNHDTWEWDGQLWSLKSTGGPSANRGDRMVFDPDRCVTVLFGGNGESTYLRETWEWDGNVWTQRCANCPPTQRHQFGMAYNNARQRVVIFGGWSGSALLNDVWEWDGTTWTQVTTTSGPSPRTEVAMSYDQTRDRIVLFGGRLQAVSCGQVTNETWELDMSVSPAVWTLVATPNAPSARALTNMVYNPTDSTMLLFGGYDICNSISGDTWVYDGVTWTEAGVSGPKARWAYAMAFDIIRDEYLLFGGLVTPLTNPVTLQIYDDETWSYGNRTGIPTVSEWGLVVLTLLCMVVGTVALARRRGGAARVA